MSELGHTIKEDSSGQYSSSVAFVDELLSWTVEMLQTYVNRLFDQVDAYVEM
jgi:hypothetical protein